MKKFKKLNNLNELFNYINSGMTLSFHHHLRNGDYILNKCLEIIDSKNLKNITLASSAIFPNNEILVKLIKNKNVTNIYTNYLNGPVSDAITKGYLDGLLYMHTHGGRARAIEEKELVIDFAIISCPTVDFNGCATGRIGKSAFGSIGYAVSDTLFAKNVCFVTDNFIEKLDKYELSGCDYLVEVDSIGDSNLIVSGTTKITKDPIQLKIASNASLVIKSLGLIQNGLSMQTGAGGTSLALTDFIKNEMVKNNIKGKFATGGITKYYVDMLEQGLLENLYDVQCFDLDAVNSFNKNENHNFMSASLYANPNNPDCMVNKLDFAVLGATEVDLDFNVNVTTDSYGNIIGGSGGHSDVCASCGVSIIVTNLIKSRLPIIKEKVLNITTPGKDVDIVVTERGIAINPLRVDLIKKLENSKLNIVPISTLLDTAYKITSIPKTIERGKKEVGYIIYRDGSKISTIYDTIGINND